MPEVVVEPVPEPVAETVPVEEPSVAPKKQRIYKSRRYDKSSPKTIPAQTETVLPVGNKRGRKAKNKVLDPIMELLHSIPQEVIVPAQKAAPKPKRKFGRKRAAAPFPVTTENYTVKSGEEVGIKDIYNLVVDIKNSQLDILKALNEVLKKMGDSDNKLTIKLNDMSSAIGEIKDIVTKMTSSNMVSPPQRLF